MVQIHTSQPDGQKYPEIPPGPEASIAEIGSWIPLDHLQTRWLQTDQRTPQGPLATVTAGDPHTAMGNAAGTEHPVSHRIALTSTA